MDVAETIAPAYEDVPSINLAAELLYPESHHRKREKREVVEREETAVSFSTTSIFDDIWMQDVEMCAYCAHEIDIDDEKCPHCGHRLSVK